MLNFIRNIKIKYKINAPNLFLVILLVIVMVLYLNSRSLMDGMIAVSYTHLTLPTN